MRLVREILLGMLVSSAIVLTSCDPGVHIAWQKDFDGPIDANCVERALRTVAADVEATSYVDDGNGGRGFEKGLTVTQFGYTDPNSIGYYSLDIARLSNGRTHYWHGWGKLGTHVPAEEQAKVVPLLNRANDAVAKQCGLSFAGTGPQEGGG